MRVLWWTSYLFRVFSSLSRDHLWDRLQHLRDSDRMLVLSWFYWFKVGVVCGASQGAWISDLFYNVSPSHPRSADPVYPVYGTEIACCVSCQADWITQTHTHKLKITFHVKPSTSNPFPKPTNKVTKQQTQKELLCFSKYFCYRQTVHCWTINFEVSLETFTV